MRSDAHNQVFENGNESDNNLESAQIFDVMRIPFADLVVSAASVDATASSGQAMNVSWQVPPTPVSARPISRAGTTTWC